MTARVLVCLLFCSVAWSQPKAVDTVVAWDGTVYRGQVAELKPGRSVSIVLLNGQTRTIPWSEIKSTHGPSFESSGAPPPTAPPPMASSPMAEPDVDPLLTTGPGRVPLEVDSATERHITVSVPTGGAQGVGYGFGGSFSISVMSYRRLCISPCTLYVRPGLFTLNTAADVSYNTSIDVPAGGVAVKMHTPTRWRGIGGAMLAAGGGSLVLVGILVAAVGPVLALDSNGNRDAGAASGYYAGGAVTALVGAGMIGGGIYLILTNHRGVAERRELNRPSEQWQVNVAPAATRGGGTLAASLRF
jgi:hypothetical protein